jgi:hypothetical protein
LGNLLHVVAEFGVGIVDAGAGLVLGRIGGAQHLDGLEGFFAGRVEDAVAAAAVHGLEGGRGRRGSWAPIWVGATDGEVVDAGERNGGDFAGQRARDLRAEGKGAEGGVLLEMAQGLTHILGLQGAVEPAVLSVLGAGSA